MAGANTKEFLLNRRALRRLPDCLNLRREKRRDLIPKMTRPIVCTVTGHGLKDPEIVSAEIFRNRAGGAEHRGRARSDHTQLTGSRQHRKASSGVPLQLLSNTAISRCA